MSTLSHYPQSVRIVHKRHSKIASKYGKGVAYAAGRLSRDDRYQFARLLWRMRAESAHERLPVVQVKDGQVGCALLYSPTGRGPWYSVSYHETVSEAVQAFKGLPSHKDRDVTRYRIEESLPR